MLRPILTYIFLLLFIIILSSCSKDETPTPKPDSEEQPKPEPTEPVNEVYFSHYSDPNGTVTNWADSWIIIHNQDGELLDYMNYKKGDSLDFEESTEKLKRTNTLSITTLNFRTGNTGGNIHSLNTTTGISKGAIWDWSDEFETTDLKPPLGNEYGLRVTVNNIPNIQHYLLSSQRDSYLAGSPFYNETDILDIGVSLQQNLDYLISLPSRKEIK